MVESGAELVTGRSPEIKGDAWLVSSRLCDVPLTPSTLSPLQGIALWTSHDVVEV